MNDWILSESLHVNFNLIVITEQGAWNQAKRHQRAWHPQKHPPAFYMYAPLNMARRPPSVKYWMHSRSVRSFKQLLCKYMSISIPELTFTASGSIYTKGNESSFPSNVTIWLQHCYFIGWDVLYIYSRDKGIKGGGDTTAAGTFKDKQLYVIETTTKKINVYDKRKVCM